MCSKHLQKIQIVKNTDVVEIDSALNQINILKLNHLAELEKFAKIIILQQKEELDMKL